jgi:hypothetical protein
MSAALDELAKAVAEWRATKGKYEHMPRPLIEQARALAAEIPESEICARLSLRRSKLFPKAAAPAFVELPPVPQATQPLPMTVEIRHAGRVVLVQLPASVELGVLFSALRS